MGYHNLLLTSGFAFTSHKEKLGTYFTGMDRWEYIEPDTQQQRVVTDYRIPGPNAGGPCSQIQNCTGSFKRGKRRGFGYCKQSRDVILKKGVGGRCKTDQLGRGPKSNVMRLCKQDKSGRA